MRTVSDWVTRAYAADDPVAAARCLTAAADLAGESGEWCAVLDAAAKLCPDDRPLLARVGDATLAAWLTDRRWLRSVVTVARVRAELLDDPAAARAALDAAARALTEPLTDSVPGSRVTEWVQLADGYTQVLADPAATRRCVDAAAATAQDLRDAEGLCYLASYGRSYTGAVLVDRAEALALVAQAQEFAAGQVARIWRVALAWRALDDPAAAERVLADALARAATLHDALWTARAYRPHGDAARVRQALELASRLATSAEDWVAIAETSHDVELPAEDVRAALERAAALADTDPLRAQVATGYQRWLADPDAADRIGPRGVRPGATRVPRRQLDGWAASPTALFDWLRARITPAAAADIAAADYGCDAEAHLTGLLDIRQTGLVPWEWDWCPHEVIALTRWSNGENVDHLARAWCCVLLYVGPGQNDEPDDIAPGLIESCLTLGEPAPRLAEELFAWAAQTAPVDDGVEDDDTDDGYDPVALLSLLMLRAAADPSDPRIATLADLLATQAWLPPDELASTLDRCVLATRWRELTDRLLQPVRAVNPALDRLLTAMGRTARGSAGTR